MFFLQRVDPCVIFKTQMRCVGGGGWGGVVMCINGGCVSATSVANNGGIPLKLVDLDHQNLNNPP